MVGQKVLPPCHFISVYGSFLHITMYIHWMVSYTLQIQILECNIKINGGFVSICKAENAKHSNLKEGTIYTKKVIGGW